MKTFRHLCVAGWVGISAFLGACGGGDAEKVSPVNFTVIDSFENSGIYKERFTVAKNEADWSALWTEHRGAWARPTVDFSQNIVIGLFSGGRPDGCHKIAITEVTQSNDMITVRYDQSRSMGGCTMAPVNPSQIATIPASNVQVEFIRN